MSRNGSLHHAKDAPSYDSTDWDWADDDGAKLQDSTSETLRDPKEDDLLTSSPRIGSTAFSDNTPPRPAQRSRRISYEGGSTESRNSLADEMAALSQEAAKGFGNDGDSDFTFKRGLGHSDSPSFGSSAFNAASKFFSRNVFSSPSRSTSNPFVNNIGNGRHINTNGSGNANPFGLDERDRDGHGLGGDYYFGDGTGRRVGYDDFTTIDWIHDYAKDTRRVRSLHMQRGLRGQINTIRNDFSPWFIILSTAISVGIIAASIDVTSDWLSDLKEGYCKPAFYLTKAFCCTGLEENEVCHDWFTWSRALSAGSASLSYLVSYVFYIFFATAFAGISAFLVHHYAPYAMHTGIPEIKTILGGFVMKKFLGKWTLIIKSLGLSLAVASGLSLGKEGPLVHVACCLGNLFLKLVPIYRNNEARKREIFSAAAAAGMSVAFGAPIGGVLFSLEEVSSYFPDTVMWHAFVCAMVAAVSLQFMNPFRTGKLVLYQVTTDRDWHGFELVFFCFLGVFGGLLGAFFINLNLRIANFRKNSWIRNYPVQEVIAFALFTALLSYLNVFMRVQSSMVVSGLFQECTQSNFMGICDRDFLIPSILLLAMAGVLKIFLTSYTFGMRIPSGVFLPSMTIGACFGRCLGLMVQAWHRAYPTAWIFASCPTEGVCVTPGVYAIIGAASVVGGVTRMTVSLVVIMFELTGALTYVLPIMIAVMISKWVGDAFSKEGIYEGWIHLHGYPFLDSKDEYIHNVIASQVMTRTDDLVVIPATGHTLDSVIELLQSHDYKGFPIVTNTRDMLLAGYISRSELRYAVNQAKRLDTTGDSPCHFAGRLPILEDSHVVDLRPWVDQTPITLSHLFPMEQVIKLFQRMGLRYVLFTKSGVLQGLLTKKDVWLHLKMTDTGSAPGFQAGGDAREAQTFLNAQRRLSALARDADLG